MVGRYGRMVLTGWAGAGIVGVRLFTGFPLDFRGISVLQWGWLPHVAGPSTNEVSRMKRDISAAVVAFLARGGKVERVKLGARAPGFPCEDDRAGMLSMVRWEDWREVPAEALDAVRYWGRS